jgi:glycosyltransferase involved in cell wall biosynthesis
VVAVSAAISRELLDSGLAAQKVSVIDNGISVPPIEDDARMRIRTEFGVPMDAKLLVQIGRLARSKRIDLLFEAVATLPLQTHTLLVGEGPEHEPLRELATTLGIRERVHFCGYRSDVGNMLAAADVMALSSEREGLPIVILEAMATRCPIVATNVGAIPEVLADGQDAWIVAANDLSQLRNAIRDALSRPEMAAARAASAYARYTKRYSRESMGARYLAIYERALEQRG